MARKNLNRARASRVPGAGMLMAVAALAASSWGQLPANFVEKTIAANANFVEATSMAHADDGSIFVSERAGNIKMIKGDNAVLIYHVNTTINREQGLLKIQVHPDFANKRWIYAYYMTDDYNHHNVSRIKLDANNAVTKVDTVIQLPALENQGRHNGSGMIFGKDGFLYVSRGNDELGGAANPAGLWTSVKGKVLRFTEEGLPAPGNPHYATGATDGEKSIWARGFRNPWTLAYDPYSGRILEGDVGDGTEELNDVTHPDPAKDYWYGYGVGGGDGVRGGNSIDPIYYHPTGDQGECAIVGEAPMNASAPGNWPAQYKDKIYAADYCGTKIWMIPLATPATPQNYHNAASGATVFYDNTKTKVGIYVGNNGDLYYVQYGTAGKAMQISYTGASTNVNNANSLSVQNFVFKAGQTADVKFTLTGQFSLHQAGKATFSILGPDGKTYFQQSVAIDGTNLQVQGFRPMGAGIYVCQLRWASEGNVHTAKGNLVVLN